MIFVLHFELFFMNFRDSLVMFDPPGSILRNLGSGALGLEGEPQRFLGRLPVAF